MRWIVLVIVLQLVLVACTFESPDTVSSTPVTGVTPIVMSTATPSIIETTPIPLITARDPVNCPNTPESRLIIQDRGRVTDNNDETLNLRNGPGTSFDILLALDPLEQFIVIDGPTCADGFAWFRVRYFGRIGWIAEGDAEEYYVEPYLTG
ncbi:MAG: SH3 domain-containing protein [Chloroflexota bacterium]